MSLQHACAHAAARSCRGVAKGCVLAWLTVLHVLLLGALGFRRAISAEAAALQPCNGVHIRLVENRAGGSGSSKVAVAGMLFLQGSQQRLGHVAHTRACKVIALAG
jgi:hypothetical protein